jgi:putative methionine-R-sulfoxide reductase with GAF domain
VPLVHRGATALVLDIDSDRKDDFGDVDRVWLEHVTDLIKSRHFSN